MQLSRKSLKSKVVVLNVVVGKETFNRVSKGTQNAVYEYFDRKRAVTDGYNKSCAADKKLVVKIWCDEMKKGNPSQSYECICIWDPENWSWFGWVPDDQRHDEWDEPGEDYFILFLGDKIHSAQHKEK